MSEPIPFPGNFDQYINLGWASLEEMKMDRAVDYFQKALVIHPSQELLVLCVTLLLDANRINEAKDLFHKYDRTRSLATTWTELDVLFIQVCLAMNDVEVANQQLHQREKVASLDPEFKQLQAQLALLEQAQSDNNKERFLELLQQMETIEKQIPMAQIHYVQQIATLERDHVLLLAKNLLEQDVHPLVITEAIYLLIDHQYTGVVTVQKGDFQAEFEIESLPKLEESPFYLLESNKIENDPIFFLHCGVFYPFEKQALVSGDEWLHAVYVRDQRNSEVELRVQEAEQLLNEIQ